MTKVYVAYKEEPYDGITEIIGVYESKKIAQEIIEKMEEIALEFNEKNPNTPSYFSYEIQEFELNKLNK